MRMDKRNLPPSANARLVKMILDRGNKAGIITEWFAGMRRWAESNQSPDAKALGLWLDIVKARPFYTADELAGLWPALKLTLGLNDYLAPKPSGNRLHNELTFLRLPLLRNQNTGMNYFPGLGSFFIVERVHYWRERGVTPEELETTLNGGEIE